MKSCPSIWYPWNSRNEYSGIEYPGVYIIVISRHNLANQPFFWSEEIVYVGMTNAVLGLKGRLTQFDNTISKKHLQHGGADRVLHKHRDYAKLSKSLYVSMRHWCCRPADLTPKDLRTMGKVAAAEYNLLSMYKQQFDKLPEFNRKESDKHSRNP